MPVYDDEKVKENTGQHDDLGMSEAERDADSTNLQRQFDSPSAPEPNIRDAEANPNAPATDKAANKEQGQLDDTLGKGFTEGNGGGGLRKKLSGRRKKAIGGGLAGLTVTGAVLGFLGITSGPLQFVHFAQLLQQFHMTHNEDFGDNRSTKALLYALVGKAEMGRLGVVSNVAADKFETKLLDQKGVRPVYSDKTKRFVGYEIVDENKAKEFRENLETNGGKMYSGEDAKKRQGIIAGKNGEVKGRVIDLRDTTYAQRRAIIRETTRSTDINRLAGTASSRLMKKRGGVDFHPLKNMKRKAGDSFADYLTRFKKEEATQIRQGVDTQTLAAGETTDPDVDPAETANIEGGTNDANSIIDEASKATSKQAIKSIISKGAGPAAVLGILCAVQGFGNDVPGYKYRNIVMPMYRSGMRVITVGNQVMSGSGFNNDELAAIDESFYDETTKTSWTDARSIQAELGQPLSGPDIPSENKLSNINEKPWIFQALDKIPALGASCGLVNGLFGLPVIKQVSGFASAITSGAINAGLSGFGTSIEDLTEKALGAAAGQTVNLDPQGAEKGNIANYGAFLASNDQALAMGGAPMSKSQSALLRSYEQDDLRQSLDERSFAQRYLDIYDHNSVASNIIDNIPSSKSQFVALFSNPFQALARSIASFSHIFTPRTFAASGNYDYGTPEIGFTAGEQNNELFDDPYENALAVEAGTNLQELNEKYSACFGLRAEPSGNSVSLVNVTAPNVFTDKGRENCDPNINKDPMFERYRYYIADLVTVKSLACYTADDTTACGELGVSD